MELMQISDDMNLVARKDEPTDTIVAGGEAHHLYMSQYYEIYQECYNFLSDVRGKVGYIPYAITFKPYKCCTDEFTYSKGMDLFTRWAKLRGAKVSISTMEEMDCQKVHIHALVYLPFDVDYSRYHDIGYANKYWVYCKPVESLSKYLAYILEESKDRVFRLGRDYRKYNACDKPQKIKGTPARR